MKRVVIGAVFAAACVVWQAGAKVEAPPRTGGELRFAIRADPKTLDPHVVMDEPSEIVQYLTAGTLVREDRVTQLLEPALATHWKVLEGGAAIEFKLRAGVTFPDGTPFTAEDVAFTIKRLGDPALHSPLAETLRSGKGDITAVVKSPLDVTVRVPNRLANLPAMFDGIPIVSGKSAKKPPAGLGPFEIAEYKPASYVLLKRNPRYWKKDAAGRQLPYLDSVRLDIMTNREMEMVRFRRGELHLLNGLDAENFDRFSKEMPGSVRDLGPSMDSEQIWFNMVPTAPIPPYKREWFRSLEFRRAVSLAINRADICRLVYRGHASSAEGPVSPGNRAWFNAKLKPVPYAPATAKELLAKAGFREQNGVLTDSGGHAVEFSVVTNAGSKTRERTAALLQQDLAKLGIKLNIVSMDFPSLIERIARTFQYEACMLGQNADQDPNEMMNVWRSSAPNHQWNPNQKKPETPWEAEIDRLMDEQAGATDAKKRKAAYDRVQEIAADQLPFIYLVHKGALVGMSPSLWNLKPSVVRPQTFWNVDTIAFNAQPGR
jgi:peptide/nickel transport system substrate-binding protein